MNVHVLILEPRCLMWVQLVHMTETHFFVCLFVRHNRRHLPSPYFILLLYFLSPCGCLNGCVLLFGSRCAPGFLGEYCQHKDPCQPGYCLNGGNCSVSMSAGVPVPGSATCSCPLGYAGQHCQIPQNSTCYPNNPCANRGICTLLPFDKYKCECARGWTGKKMWLL